MKVILIKDVAKIGRKSEIKEVQDGLARNMLIPRGFVIPATPENIKKVQQEAMRKDAKKSNVAQKFAALVDTLSDKVLTLRAKANDKGGLFSSIGPREIVDLVSKEGVMISLDQIKLSSPIKTTGRHEVTIAEGAQKGVIIIDIIAA